ncbi:HEXXH motif domain-containing protein [Actinoplanes sp. NPDC049265]|uniref:HEXXH motif domain-containing protein n=1 Tax=Actinoplanes sp. NPDC049265 TaxID=3363902 RepID=UPI00371BA04D
MALLNQALPDRDVIATLWHTQYSRRLLMVKTIIDAVDADPAVSGPLPPIAGAVAALEAAEVARPEALRETLLLPTVGSWAAYTLRRLYGFADADTPLWIDIGVLHTLALLVGFRAGLDWATFVPVRDGRLMLPGLGMALIDRTVGAGMTRARTVRGRLLLEHEDGELLIDSSTAGREQSRWWPLRRLRTGHGPGLTLALDDIDPFRELAEPVPPGRLPAEEALAWSELLVDAWQAIIDQDSRTAAAISAGMVSLTPLPRVDGGVETSGSTGEAFGALLLTRPDDHLTFAVTLIHEFAHVQLGGLLHLLDMTGVPDPATHYAPWRDDPRPLSGLLQGIYAFVAIAAFWHKRMSFASGPAAARAYFEFAHARGQVTQALDAARTSTLLTAAGRDLLDGLAGRAEHWRDLVVPAGPARAAELALRTHRAGWRLRNLRTDGATVRTVAEAWAAGREVPPIEDLTDVRPSGDDAWSYPRFRLIQGWATAVAGPRGSSDGVTIDPAEQALVAGEASAVRRFADRVARNGEDLDAWTGLCAAADGAAGVTLSRAPSLVYAVHDTLRRSGVRADPLALAEWMAGGLSRAAAASGS